MDNLSKKLGIQVLEKPTQQVDNVSLQNSTLESEQLYSNENLKAVITNAMVNLPQLTTELENNTSPRMIEAVAAYYTMVANLNKMYVDMTQKVMQPQQQNITNNTAIIVSTEELIDKIRHKIQG